MKPVLIATVVLAAAACASSPQWSKKEASADQTRSDLLACSTAASREVAKIPQPHPSMGPAVMQPPGRRSVSPAKTFSDPEGERYMQESRLTGECMRGKGYEQGPAKN